MPAAVAQPNDTPTLTVGPRDFPASEFVNFSRPVFAEHTTKDREGNPVVYDRYALQAMCDTMNQRIRETGDYSAISIGHTPDMEQMAQGMKMPPLVGFAGPFKVAPLGQTGRYAIYADCHVRRDKLDVVKDHPRVSPEVWLTADIRKRFLDPIALLGAEAPRLDLGILYCRTAGGELVEKYTATAAMPSAGNSFLPSEDYAADPGSTPTPNQGSKVMLDPQDIQQIVAALEQTDWAQWCKAKMASEAGPAPSVPGADAGLGGGAPPAAPPGAMPAGAPPGAPPAPPTDNADQDKSAARYQAGEDDPEPPAEPPAPPPEEKDKMSQAHAADPLARARYAKMEADNKAMADKVRRLEERQVNSDRYHMVSELRRSLAFDETKFVDPEQGRLLEKYSYGNMSDATFRDTLELIADIASPIPVGASLYAPDDAIPRARNEQQAERYARETSEEAVRMCRQAQDRGETLAFETALAQVRAKSKTA